MWDELDEPLGFVAGAAPTLTIRDKRPMRGTATVAAILAVAVALVMLQWPEFPVKGQPFAVAKVEILPAPPKLVVPDATASLVQTPTTSAASGEQVERTSGIKIAPGSGGPPKPLFIDVAEALRAKLPPAPDGRPLDKSKYGPLPHIAVDGIRGAQPDH